jgi:hypothetical protein
MLRLTKKDIVESALDRILQTAAVNNIALGGHVIASIMAELNSMYDHGMLHMHEEYTGHEFDVDRDTRKE